METKTYWVGDRPGGAWFFKVLDQKSGAPYNLTGFTQVRAVMLDSDNREVTFPADNAAITDAATGSVTFLWPDESVFDEAGDYVMQLEFVGTGSTRRTTVQHIRVQEIGGASR